MDIIDFRLGQIDVTLEVPPFFVNFDKRDFSSMMTRQKKAGRKALFYIYISRKNHLSKLLLLKALHPDIAIPRTLKLNEEITKEDVETFLESVQQTEKEWTYYGIGLWNRDFFESRVYMVLIVGSDRWTMRPLVSKEGLTGFGAEIPIATNLSSEFLEALKDEEKQDLEIHEHIENKHFHLTVYSKRRFVQLVKKWDYYFAQKERWEMSVKLESLENSMNGC